MKAATSTAPAPNAPVIRADSQPYDGPSMIPNSTATRPAISSTAPSGSVCPWAERSVRGTTRATTAISSAASGTMAQNSARQPRN